MTLPLDEASAAPERLQAQEPRQHRRMDNLRALQALGLTLPSPAYIFGAVLFGLIGWVGFRAGRRRERTFSVGLGLVLMLYPYAVSSTWLLYALGVALSAGLYLDQR